MKCHALKRFTALITLVILIAASLPLNLSAASAAPKTDSVGNIYLYCIDSDTVLYEKNADTKIAPLSTARMMTALILIENLKDRLDEVIVVSQNATNTTSQNRLKPYSLKPSEEIKIRDLLYAVIMSGAADATRALVFCVSETISDFTVLMNNKAKELMMNDTFYISPEGAQDNSFTTARDVAKLALYAYSNPLYMQIASMQRHVIAKTNKAEAREIHTTNYLISKWIYPDYYMNSVNGLIAGDIFTGDRNVVATANIENFNYLCVSMGGIEYGQYIVTKSLLTWASKSFEYKTLLSEFIIVGELPVKNALKNDYVAIVPEKNIEAFLSVDVDVKKGIAYNYEFFHKELKAPVKEGEVVGVISAIYNGEKIGETNLITKYNVNMGRVQFLVSGIKSIILSWWFILLAIIFLLCVIGYILLKARIRYLSAPKISIQPARTNQNNNNNKNINNNTKNNIGGKNEKNGS